jgi:hypothetical protein
VLVVATVMLLLMYGAVLALSVGLSQSATSSRAASEPVQTSVSWGNLTLQLAAPSYRHLSP